MTVIIALDDKDGYTLFGKRLSRDRKMIDDIASSFQKVYVFLCSANLFEGKNAEVIETIPEELPDNEALFLETNQIPAAADTLIVYRWGKKYPSDTKYNPAKYRWYLKESKDFEGYSHPKMKKEVYKK